MEHSGKSGCAKLGAQVVSSGLVEAKLVPQQTDKSGNYPSPPFKDLFLPSLDQAGMN